MRIHSNISNVSGHSEGHNILPFFNSRLSANSNNNSVDQNGYYQHNNMANGVALSMGSAGANHGSCQLERHSIFSKGSFAGSHRLGGIDSTNGFNGSNYDGLSAHNEQVNQLG